MVRNQDDNSFVSWTATLHPESAVSSVDPRVQSGSTWATVYHETCGGADSENVPIAIQVVPLDEEEDEANAPQHQQSQHDPESQLPATEIDGTNETGRLVRPQPWKHSSLVDLILGFSLALASFLSTIKIEIAAIIVYTLAAGFHFLADEIFASTPMLLPKSICLTISAVLMIADAVLLTVSVLVTEILGGVAFFVCALFGGPRSGKEWHQFIRKACHMTRWGFRSCHKDWKPARIFPISMEDEREQMEELQYPDCGDDEENHNECGLPQYSDVPHSPTIAALPPDDVSTITDTARYTHGAGSSPPRSPEPAAVVPMVDPENVLILDSEGQDDDPHFVKNTQLVVIT